MTPIRKYLAYGISSSFLVKVVGLGASLGLNIVLARTLGADQFGAYTYIMALIYLLAVPATLGFPEFIVREGAIYGSRGEWGFFKGLLRRVQQVALSMGVVICVIAAGAGIVANYSRTYAFLLALPILLVNTLSGLRVAALRALRHVTQGQLTQSAVRPLVFLCLAGGLWAAGEKLNVIQAIGLQLFSSVVVLVASLVLLTKAFPSEARTAVEEFQTSRWLRGVLPFFFLGAAFHVSNQIDIVMLGAMRDSTEVGVYKVAAQGAQLVVFILVAVNTTIGPVVSEVYVLGDLERLRRVATFGARAALVGSVPVGLAFIFYGRPLISFMFGSQYTGASAPLAVLCIGQLINAGMGSVGLILNMTGHEKDSLKGVVAAAVLNIALNALLIPRFGMYGAAWATTISMIFWNFVLQWYVMQRLGIRVDAYARIRG